MYIPNSSIYESNPFLGEGFKNVALFKGSHKMYCSKYHGNNTIHVSEISESAVFVSVQVLLQNDETTTDKLCYVVIIFKYSFLWRLRGS